MPSPIPKHPSTRQRRNKTVGIRTLHIQHDVQAPALPERQWHQQTVDWWESVWASPMAPEYDDSDRHGLYVLAVLVDAFWHEPSKELAGEIRLQRQNFGLTPLDRRRLQWEVDRGEEAAEKTQKRRSPRAVVEEDDPRKTLAG